MDENYRLHPVNRIFKSLAGFSLRIEVVGGHCKIIGESGHPEKNVTSSFYRPMTFSRKIPCSIRRILRSPMLNEHPVLREKPQRVDLDDSIYKLIASNQA